MRGEIRQNHFMDYPLVFQQPPLACTNVRDQLCTYSTTAIFCCSEIYEYNTTQKSISLRNILWLKRVLISELDLLPIQCIGSKPDSEISILFNQSRYTEEKSHTYAVYAISKGTQFSINAKKKSHSCLVNRGLCTM